MTGEPTWIRESLFVWIIGGVASLILVLVGTVWTYLNSVDENIIAKIEGVKNNLNQIEKIVVETDIKIKDRERYIDILVQRYFEEQQKDIEELEEEIEKLDRVLKHTSEIYVP